MSKTFSIACRECQKHVWIAQGIGVPSAEFNTFYSGDPGIMDALKGFLFVHAGHNLVFGDNCESPIIDWEEIKPEGEAPLT